MPGVQSSGLSALNSSSVLLTHRKFLQMRKDECQGCRELASRCCDLLPPSHRSNRFSFCLLLLLLLINKPLITLPPLLLTSHGSRICLERRRLREQVPGRGEPRQKNPRLLILEGAGKGLGVHMICGGEVTLHCFSHESRIWGGEDGRG